MLVAGPQPVSSRRVDPDPSITSAIGRHHSLATAVADLVDNSIDANARNVLVRFVLADGVPRGLEVIDDGRGMDTAAVDDAMTYARKRNYGEADLGHFGIGLKAASLSQADSLIVWSRRYGAPAVGRRILRSTIDSGPVVDSYDSEDAESKLNRTEVDFPLQTGTVVEWNEVRTFLHTSDTDEQRGWLERQVDTLLTHLGLVMHRILAHGDVRIHIEEYDVEFGAGAPRMVTPLDPFGYDRTGVPGYPAELRVTLPEGHATAVAHIWAERERSKPGYVLDGRGPLDTQGLYVYRRDRLLQVGGWNELAMRARDLQYGRIALEITPETEHHITINPEKTGVVLDATLKDALLAARAADGTTFGDFRLSAETGARTARKRQARPVTVVEPRGGLPVEVLAAFEEATQFDLDEPSVEIRWSTLPAGQFFRIDRETRALVLNLRYRAAVVGHPSTRRDDAPLVKSLLYLLVNEHFGGSYQGAKARRHESAWQTILVAAAISQAEQLDGGDGA